MSEMACEWLAEAYPDMAAVSPVTSAALWVCPVSETVFPPTVMLVASIEENSSWSNLVVA